jgi:hypothetical protein
MANFCNKCGAPSDGGAFCGGCGADMRKAPSVAQPQPVQAASPAPVQPAFQNVPVAQAPVQPQPIVQAAPVQKGSPLVKIVIGVVAFLFIGAALAIGGVYYVVYRVKQKVQEVKTEVLGETASSSNAANGSSSGSTSSGSGSTSSASGSTSSGSASSATDGCQLLSKEEVGQALGIEIAATEPTPGGCSYMAVGTSADFTAKHLTSLQGVKGADDKTKQLIQGLAGGLFKATQSEHPNDKPDKDGKVPVMSFSIDTNSAETQMELNEKVLGGLGPREAPIEGIGDHAFDAAGSMMMVRKGDKLVRIMYSMCPCGVEAIKPLAKKLADRL